MQVFVPFNEELLERHPDLVGRLVPYRPGLPCAHQDGIRQRDRAREVPPDAVPRRADAA